MKLNRKWLLVTALVLSLTMATAGTLAYLTDRDTVENTFTMGNVDIEVDETFEPDSPLNPGVEVEKQAGITNTHNTSDAWVWMTVSVPEDLADYLELGWLDSAEVEELDAPVHEGYVSYLVKHPEILEPGDTTPMYLQSVTLSETVDFQNGEYVAVEGGSTVSLGDLSDVTVIVDGFAMQTNGFDTVDDAYTAYASQWGGMNGGDSGAEGGAGVTVSSDEEALAALTADEKNIVVKLAADITFDTAAWENNSMGGESTESVTIYGNGHTITFNQTNSDWNSITTTNDAVLTISNADLTNSGHNNGPWNRHDLYFDCDVVLKDINSDKAMAFGGAATLENVVIADANTADTYAIWIRPNGQTVTLDGCTIDMLAATDGRGLKIDEQYLDAAAKVTLKVSDTVFKTEEKSAILVKSTAGADIILSNVDISAVAADSTNPVWVDADSTAYANLVTVTGGTKINEP